MENNGAEEETWFMIKLRYFPNVINFVAPAPPSEKCVLEDEIMLHLLDRLFAIVAI